MSIIVLTAGVIAATVTDEQVMSNVPGMLVGAVFIVVSCAYGILVGSKQRQLHASALSATFRLDAPDCAFADSGSKHAIIFALKEGCVYSALASVYVHALDRHFEHVSPCLMALSTLKF